MSTERFYLSQNTIGRYLICDRQRAIPPLPGQHYGFCKKWLAQKYVNDLNAGIETPESLYAVWNAGNRRIR